MERRHKVEQGEDASFAQRIEGLVDAGNGELGERAYGVELLVVHRDRTLPYFFSMATMGLDYDEVECWMIPAAMY